MPGGPIAWPLFWVGAVIVLVGAGGLWLAARRFHGGPAGSLSPIAALGAWLALLVGLFAMFWSLNLWGSLGA